MLASGWVFRRHYRYLNSDPFSLLMCGDENANPATLDNFLAFWTVKHACCCFPAGICRDFKKMNLTPDDLTYGRCKTLLYWTAATLQMSIADVEAMHSQNRALQGSSFASISSKFVNSEAVRVRDEARRLQFGKDDSDRDRGKTERLTNMVSSEHGIKVIQKTKEPTPKGQSALEIFRKHFLRLNGQSEKVNPCSKQHWADVREAFAKLTAREKTLYQSLSHDSKINALSRRKVIKHNMKQQRQLQQKPGTGDTGDQHSLTAVVEHGGDGEGVHLQILPVHDLCNIFHNAGDEGIDPLKQVFQRHLGTKGPSLGKSEHPIGESALESVWRSQVRSGIDGKTAAKIFQRQAESVARPDDQQDVFPDRVVHEGYCGEQCRHHSTPKRIAQHCNLLALLNYIVQKTLGGRMGVVLVLPNHNSNCSPDTTEH